MLGATNVAGLNLYKGNSYVFENVSPYVDHDSGNPLTFQIAKDYVSPQHKAGAPATGDDYLKQLARADIRADPLRFLRMASLKVVSYLSPVETPLGERNWI